MQEIFLCLNPNKTKILLVVLPSLKDTIVINGTFVHSAYNLGVILDDTLPFRDQILSTVKSCFNVTRNHSKIKDFLSYDLLKIRLLQFLILWSSILYLGQIAIRSKYCCTAALTERWSLQFN